MKVLFFPGIFLLNEQAMQLGIKIKAMAREKLDYRFLYFKNLQVAVRSAWLQLEMGLDYYIFKGIFAKP